MSTLKVGEIKHESFTGTTQLKLDSAGRLLLGTTTEGHTSGDNLTIAATDGEPCGITLRSDTDEGGRIFFSDGTSGADEYRGVVGYGHDTNHMYFSTDATERLRIDSSGKVGISTTSPVAQTLAGGTAITPVLDLKGVTQNNTSGILQFTRKDNATQGSCIYSSGDDAGLTMRNTDGNGFGFYNGTTQAMRIDPSGRVLIGTTTDNGFKFKISDGGGYEFAFAPNDSGVNSLVNYNRSGSAYVPFMVSGSDLRFGSGGNTERMRIDSSGRVGIGTTNPEYLLNVVKGGVDMCRFQQTTNNESDGYEAILIKHAAALSGQNGIGLRFQNSSGTTVGKIDFGQSTTQYRTSSDYRLKENATAISDGITRLKTLKPYQFNWIAEKGQPKVDGFFAHEVTAVPEAISGTKDEVDSDNKPLYQSIDQSKLIPLLTAALQEAIGKIETLETKVAALEAK